MKNPKISFIWDSVVDKVYGDPKAGGVTGVRLKNLKTGETQDFKTDGLFIAETVNPHSIQAFKMFWIPPWSPANCDLLIIGEEPIQRTFTALGYGYRFIRDYDREHRHDQQPHDRRSPPEGPGGPGAYPARRTGRRLAEIYYP